MVKSPRLSFKGYKLSEALYRNKDLVKALIVLITGYGYFTGFELSQFLIALSTGVLALTGKLLLDAADYFFTEVDL
jgi:hypothetical protein